ncbi:hypothetical protein BD770DRAFT_133756 [Pilaira anomala]|nr:hypothetical protein BD770DRAFT_133756 [Pilaira anomala]
MKENLVQWDTNEKEKEEYYLGQIEPEQFLSEQQAPQSGSSYFSSPIYKEFPVTPELSPRPSRHESSYSIYTPMTINHEEEDKEVATATSSLYISTPSQNPYYKKRTQSSSSSNKATLKTLQSEVAALCEEINHLRVKERHPLLLRWRLILLFKSVAKHIFLNILILFLLFLVLWRRKSPIAYTIIAYTGPRTRDLLRYISQRVVFWKVTV